MGDLLPNEALIYERSNGVVYARYRDKPEIKRWIIGGDPDAVSRAEGNLFSYSEWNNMLRLASKHYTLKTQMQKMLDIYYIVKDNE